MGKGQHSPGPFFWASRRGSTCQGSQLREGQNQVKVKVKASQASCFLVGSAQPGHTHAHTGRWWGENKVKRDPGPSPEEQRLLPCPLGQGPPAQTPRGREYHLGPTEGLVPRGVLRKVACDGMGTGSFDFLADTVLLPHHLPSGPLRARHPVRSLCCPASPPPLNAWTSPPIL